MIGYLQLCRVAVSQSLRHLFSTRSLIRYLFIALAGAAGVAFAPPARAIEIQVEILTDSLAQPPAPVSNVCTLRKAVNNANDNLATYPQCQAGDVGNDTIVFNLPGTITFALAGINEDGGETGDLDITDSLTIIGHPDGTVIDAAHLDRIFDINPGNAVVGIVVILRNIHITNGTGLGAAGAIQLRGATLILENCTISNSFANQGDGGGIAMGDNALLNMTNSTLSGNIGNHHAGALVVVGGTANITNSTITGNSTSPGFTNLTGGIRNTGTVNLRNTIVAGNNPGGDLPNLDGQFNSLGYNIIGELGDNTPLNPVIIPVPGTADQIDVNDSLLNFGPLQNNGGPTPTRALLAGSIAKDKGHSSGSMSDQRGETRPCDDGAITNATGGDGGDVGAFEVQGVCVTGGSPDAVDDAASTSEETTVTINALANDTDPDGDTLTVTAVTQGANGSVVNNGDGTVTYTPNLNFFGTDSFTYTIDDGNGGMDTASVTVTVTNVNDDPDAANDAATVAEDSAAIVITVLANDFDVDGDALIVAAVTQGTNGTVTNTLTSVSYTPNADFFGTDTFTYTISDGFGGFDTATVTVTVNNINDVPVAEDDSYSMNQDMTLTVAAPGVLGNDTDVDGDTLTSVLVSNVTSGMLVLNFDGSFTYTPNAGFTGTDTFTYKANDGTVDSDIATVTIAIADTQGPNLTSSVSATSLWPPTYNLINVGLVVNATDNSGDPVTTQVLVFSDEDDLTLGSGEHSPDARDIAPGTLRLRADRSGEGDGRVYLIVIVATDSADNVSRNCLTVVVPHSQTQLSKAAVNQQAQVALAYCAATGNPPPGFFVVGDGPVVGPKQ